MRFDLVTAAFLVIIIPSSAIQLRNQQVCGQVKKKTIVSENIVNAQPGSSPWHAGIYELELGTFRNKCCGTIIAPHVILTAAKCVFNYSERIPKEAALFKVIVGKLAYEWSDADSNAQELEISSIHVINTYLGDINSYAQNIALLGLKNDIEFNDVVQPACIDWFGNGIKSNSALAKVSGWGLKRDGQYSKILKETGMPFLTRGACYKKFLPIARRSLRFINYDKFCIVTEHGRKEGDTGAGLVFTDDDRYYIHGILSANIAPQFSLATNITKYLSWIKDRMLDIDKENRCPGDGFMCSDGCIEVKHKCDGYKDCSDGLDESVQHCGGDKKPVPKGGCVLPNQKGGASYEIVDCDGDKCVLKALSRVSPNTKVRIKCGIGYAPPDGKPHVAACVSGSWFPDSLECTRLCNALQKDNVVVTCTYKGDETNCNSYMRPGTSAKYNCKKHYKMKDPLAFSGNSKCMPTGEWQELLPTCVPECGFVNKNNDATPTIAGGEDTVYGKYPWHVGIFYKISYNTSYVNICGGSIINPHMVLTAAHCLYDKQTKKKFNYKDMAIAAGKFKRDWYHSEPYQQSTFVKELITPETFTGSLNRYEHDIALIEVQVPFLLNDFVLPVCLDWGRNGIYPPNTKGTIVGWGFTEQQVYSENLQEITLPVTDIVSCRSKFGFFIEFLTYDKFCAIYKDGFGGARAGDSGGSMTFPRGEAYFVHGVVSLKPTKDDRFGALTNVTEHLDWIKQQINSHKRS